MFIAPPCQSQNLFCDREISEIFFLLKQAKSNMLVCIVRALNQ